MNESDAVRLYMGFSFPLKTLSDKTILVVNFITRMVLRMGRFDFTFAISEPYEQFKGTECIVRIWVVVRAVYPSRKSGGFSAGHSLASCSYHTRILLAKWGS
jgi:hypothetical protein